MFYHWKFSCFINRNNYGAVEIEKHGLLLPDPCGPLNEQLSSTAIVHMSKYLPIHTYFEDTYNRGACKLAFCELVSS